MATQVGFLWHDAHVGWVTGWPQVLVSVPTLRYGVGRPVIGASTVTAAGAFCVAALRVHVPCANLAHLRGRPVCNRVRVSHSTHPPCTGGIMTGSLTLGLSDVYPPASGNFWTLPPGNTFRVHSTTAIHRINHLGPDRFVKGTRIVLLFQVRV